MIMNQRSDVYYEAGLELLSKQLYSQSIACFYYSVLQKMLYSLTVSPKRPMEYEDQNPLDEDIHERTLIDIISRLNRYKDVEKMKDYFRNKMLPLRKKADYEPDRCSLEECVNCREWCESLRRLLDERFKVA